MNFEDFFGKDGFTGKIIYNEDDDCYELVKGEFAIGLQSNGWSDYENMEVNIKVEVRKR